MRVSYVVGTLACDDDWFALSQSIGGEHLPVVRSTIRHLKILGACSYVVEDPYIDRDYSSDYLHFYARTFRQLARHCKRLHFFTQDVAPLLDENCLVLCQDIISG